MFPVIEDKLWEQYNNKVDVYKHMYVFMYEYIHIHTKHVYVYKHIYSYKHICIHTMHTDVPGDRGQTLGAI
jgi:hypothetical protein